MGPWCPLYMHTIGSSVVSNLRLHETTSPCSVPTRNLAFCNQKQKKKTLNMNFHNGMRQQMRAALTILFSNSIETAPKAFSRFPFLLGSSTSRLVGSFILRMSQNSTWCQIDTSLSTVFNLTNFKGLSV